MRLLVTGASGLLGLHLALVAAEEQHEVTGQVHSHPLRGVPFRVVEAGLDSPESVDRLVELARPDTIVHCTALAYPDRCEENPGLSERLNALLPGWVAQVASQNGIRLVHLSTDAVFDGRRGYFREEDSPNPLNTYARHKLAGEQAVAECNPQALIVRSVFYGWSLNGRRSLAEFFYNNLKAGKQVQGWTDAYFCPLLVDDLARLLLLLLDRGQPGVYHVASSEAITKYEFGVAIARLFGFDERLVTPVSQAESGLKANRSADLSLNTDKAQAALGAPLPGQMPGLWQFFRQEQEGLPARIRSYGAGDG